MSFSLKFVGQKHKGFFRVIISKFSIFKNYFLKLQMGIYKTFLKSCRLLDFEKNLIEKYKFVSRYIKQIIWTPICLLCTEKCNFQTSIKQYLIIEGYSSFILPIAALTAKCHKTFFWREQRIIKHKDMNQ